MNTDGIWRGLLIKREEELPLSQSGAQNQWLFAYLQK